MEDEKKTAITDEKKTKKEKTNMVRIYIPREVGTQNFEVGLNGEFYKYPRGTYQEVPKEVAAIIEYSVEAEQGAGAFDAWRIDGKNPMGVKLDY